MEVANIFQAIKCWDNFLLYCLLHKRFCDGLKTFMFKRKGDIEIKGTQV